jgi:tRNA U34 5-methylaminomethyl-2-thiouridine-forming methyltransferase MnmC
LHAIRGNALDLFSTSVESGIVEIAARQFAWEMSGKTEDFEIVTVASGARSLRSRAHGETFHPVVGPMAEAQALHVRQQRLVERADATDGPFIIWDVGLGAAANAIAALEAFRDFRGSARIELHSFDETTAPLAFALAHAETLEYLAPHRPAVERLVSEGEAADGVVRWLLHLGDFRSQLGAAPAPHAILYDPYSPRANPELWTLDHFTRLHERLDPARACLLSNYTRSTAVRVTLLLAGFFVGHGHATGEKDQTTIAANRLELLECPLGQKWLARVERSTRGAPLRVAEEGAPIAAADLTRLHAHPQFANAL